MRHWIAVPAAAVVALSFGFAGQAEAATIVVSPANDLKNAVESAIGGDVVELLQGTHSVTCAPGTTCIAIPAGVTIMADPTAPHGTVVVEGGDNSNRISIFGSSGQNITISGLKFVPDPAAANGGRAIWIASGGGDLVFADNIVHQFTDAMFARNQTSGSIDFRNNVVTIVDRDPAANGGFLGGNAALTVLFATLDNLDASGNVVHGPGRNVDRFVAVSGLIVFNFDTDTIGSIDIWNNAISNFDIAVFASGAVGDGTTVAENRLHSNGGGVQVGQVPDPDITDPTPAHFTDILKNRITGNDFGVIVAENAEDTFLERNQIAGNREAAVLDLAAPGETMLGDNLIRGKDTGNVPSIPPGAAFDPVTGAVQ